MKQNVYEIVKLKPYQVESQLEIESKGSLVSHNNVQSTKTVTLLNQTSYTCAISIHEAVFAYLCFEMNLF